MKMTRLKLNKQKPAFQMAACVWHLKTSAQQKKEKTIYLKMDKFQFKYFVKHVCRLFSFRLVNLVP